jgi:predicted lipoprotein
MNHRSRAAVVLALALLAGCEPAPSADAGPSVESTYHQALLVMLDCRNRFTTAMQTLSRAAPSLSAQERLKVLSQATTDRIYCEGRIDPILAPLRARTGG